MDEPSIPDLLESIAFRIRTNGHDEKTTKVVETLLETVENYESIDREMVTVLQSYLGNDLINKDAYNSIIKEAEAGSTIVYFKSAQLFKIYKKDELNSLLGGQMRTIYRNFDQSYEIVPKESKQKIIIIGNAALANRMNIIKTHIMLFMQEKGLITFKEEDIVCFRTNDAVEIIINNYYVENALERDEIVKELLMYIFKKEKNKTIAGNLSTPQFSDFAGADMVAMPSDKELISTRFVEYIDSLVGNVERCAKINKAGNTYIINFNVQNQNAEIINNNEVMNNADVIIQNSGSETSEPEVGDFGKYIKTKRPKWYMPGKPFDKEVLLQKYIEIYGNISKRMFHDMFSNRIFDKSTRVTIKGVRTFRVTLFEYDNITTLDN